MRACCPLALLLRSRAFLLWAAVLIPLLVLAAAAVSVEIGEESRAASGCPAPAAARDPGISCQEMHVRLRREDFNAAPPPAACPAAP